MNNGQRVSVRSQRARNSLVALLFLLPVVVSACGDEIPLLPNSLESPAGLSAARTCIAPLNDGLGTSFWTDPSRCEAGGDVTGGSINTTGLIVNRQRQSLMLFDYDSVPPELLDIQIGEPGVTGVSVCDGPSQVVTSSDGIFAIVLCDESMSVSVVSLPHRREVFRSNRRTVETQLAAAPDDSLLAFAQPELNQVQLERFEFTCGSDAEFTTGCEPTVTMETIIILGTSGAPTHLAFGEQGRLFVTYRDLPFVSIFELSSSETVCLNETASAPCETARIGLTFECGDGLDNDGDGLIDQADLQCFGPTDAESPEGIRGVSSVCADGLDNDGDGLVDHDDVDCINTTDQSETGAVRLARCADGIDNDGDGSVDLADEQCFDSGWDSELSAPACADGIDNDSDGLVDTADDQCIDSLWSDESRLPSCSDSEDNDADGNADFPEDFDCIGPLMDSEQETPACNNGVDDDGDGFIDRGDPGCGNLSDESEDSTPPACADGADNDNDGAIDLADPDCFGAAGNRESSVLTDGFGPISLHDDEQFLYVIDPPNNQVLVIDINNQQLLDANAGDFLRTGLGVSTTDSGVLVQPAGYGVSATVSDSGSIQTGVTEEVAIVPSSDGIATVVDISTTFFVDDVTRSEGTTWRLRPRDGDTSNATTWNLSCEIPDDLRDAIRASRGDDTDTRIYCSDPEIPQLQIDEDGVDVRFIQEERFTLDGTSLTTEMVPYDFRIRDETWTITYEASIPNATRSDGLVEEGLTGVIVTSGVDFCGLGIEPGDHIRITAASPALDIDSSVCGEFFTATLEYEIDYIRADRFFLSVLTDQEGVVQSLPTRDCFSSAVTYSIYAPDTWIVEGSATGFLHDQMSLSEQCVERTGDPRRTGRLFSDTSFENVFFEIVVSTSAIPPTPTTAVSFNTENAFAGTALGIGPTPVDVNLTSTANGLRLAISDGGVDTVFIFDASTLLAVANLF